VCSLSLSVSKSGRWRLLLRPRQGHGKDAIGPRHFFARRPQRFVVTARLETVHHGLETPATIGPDQLNEFHRVFFQPNAVTSAVGIVVLIRAATGGFAKERGHAGLQVRVQTSGVVLRFLLDVATGFPNVFHDIHVRCFLVAMGLLGFLNGFNGIASVGRKGLVVVRSPPTALDFIVVQDLLATQFLVLFRGKGHSAAVVVVARGNGVFFGKAVVGFFFFQGIFHGKGRVQRKRGDFGFSSMLDNGDELGLDGGKQRVAVHGRGGLGLDHSYTIICGGVGRAMIWVVGGKVM